MTISNITRHFSLYLFVCALVLVSFSSEARSAVVLSGGGLTLVEEGPAAAAAGGAVPPNLALSGTPLAHGELSGFGHLTSELNDGFYGNAFSWIGDGPVPADGPYAGIGFSNAHLLNGIAFGRSNVLSGDPCGGGVCTDRNLGLYTLQYTQVASPGTAITTLDPATGWDDIGTLDYISAGGANFSAPHQRHRYTFDAVLATGVRLIVPGSGLGGGTAIDEIELFAIPEPSTFVLLAAGGLALFASRRRRLYRRRS